MRRARSAATPSDTRNTTANAVGYGLEFSQVQNNEYKIMLNIYSTNVLAANSCPWLLAIRFTTFMVV